MATFFGEILEPSTRALFDDYSDEESDDIPTLEIRYSLEEGKNILKDIDTFLVVDGHLALAFAEAYLLDGNHLKVGNINYYTDKDLIDEIKKVSTSSPIIVQGKLLVVFVNPLLPNTVAFDFTELVFSQVFAKEAKKIVILTSQSASSYKCLPGEIPPTNAVYSLLSSSFSSAPIRPLLPESNILTGIPAAVASWCEINSVPASVFVCYSDSQTLDSLTAKPLLGILPQKQTNPDLKRRWVYGGSGPPTDSLSNMYM